MCKLCPTKCRDLLDTQMRKSMQNYPAYKEVKPVIPCMISFTLHALPKKIRQGIEGGGGIGPTEGVLTTLSHQHIKQRGPNVLRGGWGLRTTIQPKKTFITTCYLSPPPARIGRHFVSPLRLSVGLSVPQKNRVCSIT